MSALSLPLVVSENCRAYNTLTVHNNHILKVKIVHFQVGRVYDDPKLDKLFDDTNNFNWINAA